MSKKNGHTDSPPYISQVHLKGYKSIQDTKIKLHPGLNILIGPNGSGKTNFLELMFFMVRFQYHYLNTGFESKMELCADDNINIWQVALSGMYYDEEIQDIQKEITEEFYEKGIKSKGPLKIKLSARYNPLNPSKEKIRNFLKEYFYPVGYLNFHLPQNSSALDDTIVFSITKNSLQPSFNNKGWVSMFVNQFLGENFYNGKLKGLKEITKEILLKKLQVSDSLLRNLRKFSPIQGVKVDEGFSINQTNLVYNISYFTFQFLINEKWLSWSMLSDGTKKLFYIISEITLNKGICFVEEPEMGVHPDQYRKILNFLKEASEEKQIIITTHAPRTLDILTDKELNRIILTRFDKELGTKMRHLTKEEIKEVIEYREKEGSTSELWSYTGFFDEEEVI